LKGFIDVIGGGLAGSEASLQLASRGARVRLFEMRPGASTPAHRTPYLAELVCSNSLKSTDPSTASGLLKKELEQLGCVLLGLAYESSVEAGHALAVDREVFAKKVTLKIEETERIELIRKEVKEIPDDANIIVATGPLTSESLSKSIEYYLDSKYLYFYDAISISISSESIDKSIAFKASRYGKGGDDYWNIPLDKDDYEKLIEFLITAPKVELKDFEDTKYFESCLPIEVIAERGRDALRFGPLKPKGLINPTTVKEPFAVIQLRKENREGTMYGLVGFQTRLLRPAQRELLKMLPGFRQPIEILRWGAIHRNTFINSPEVLDQRQMSLKRPGLFFSGQLVGVEGYMESIAHGLVTAINMLYFINGKTAPLFPEETIIGGLQRHLIEKKKDFQPMNANFGLLPPLKAPKKIRKKLMVERSLERMHEFISRELSWLF